jgi:hypothetical protein
MGINKKLIGGHLNTKDFRFKNAEGVECKLLFRKPNRKYYGDNCDQKMERFIGRLEKKYAYFYAPNRQEPRRLVRGRLGSAWDKGRRCESNYR